MKQDSLENFSKNKPTELPLEERMARVLLKLNQDSDDIVSIPGQIIYEDDGDDFTSFNKPQIFSRLNSK